MKEKKETGKVIPFPGLANRLIDKGMDALVNKEFREAAELLTKALELKDEDYNAQFGLVVALVELGRYRDAKEHCLNILRIGIGDYFKTMEMYVMILLQLNEYEEMEATVHALLDEGHVPIEKEEQFEKMLEFSRRMSVEHGQFQVDEVETDFELQLFSKTNEEQLILMTKLKDENARKYLDEIKDYLQSPDGHPVIKTMLLLVLKEQEVQETCDIEKFLKHTSVIPSELEDMHEREFFTTIVSLLEDVLENENPTLFELAKHLIERHQFAIYPMEPNDSFESWSAAYHLLAEQYQGLDSNEEDIISLYNGDNEKVNEILGYIQHIEEISSI